jgi:hypothetical protein
VPPRFSLVLALLISTYLRTLAPHEAAQVAGSKVKRDALLAESSVDDILNAGRPAVYRLRRVGDIQKKMSTLDDFWHGKTNQTEHPIAQLSRADMELIGAKQSTVLLSTVTLNAHRKKHPEIGLDDYRKIPEIIANGQVWSVPGNPERIIFIQIDDVIYRAAVKRTADGQKNYLLTLFKNTKKKPPKGAVRIR